MLFPRTKPELKTERRLLPPDGPTRNKDHSFPITPIMDWVVESLVVVALHPPYLFSLP